MPALSLADEKVIFAVSCACLRSPRSPAFPHSMRSPVRIPALRRIPAHAVSARLSCLF